MSKSVQFTRKTGACWVALLIAQGLLAQQPGTTSGTSDREMKPPSAAAPRPGGAYVPMTQGDRVRYYFAHMFSAESFLRSAAGAGINQALNTPSEWHQGAEGYGRRFASVYGGHIVQATSIYGLSAVLHEDNRYFQSGESDAGARFKYAVASSFLARHTDGSRHVSISRLTSYLISAAVSRSWQPSSTRGWIHGADAFGVSIGVETGFNVAREFVPKIFHSRPPVTAVNSTTHQ